MAHGYSVDDMRTRLFTGVLSDVLDSLDCLGQVCGPSLHPLSPDTRLVGYARTARAAAVNRTPTAPYARLLSAIDDLSNEDVLLLAMEPMSTSAIFGGLLATAVKVAGGRGVIVDGYARDAQEIMSIGLPTFVKGLMPLDSYGRDEVVAVNEPVAISGVIVHPGDLVFADIDGVVVVPSRLEDEVVTKAFEKVSGEGEVRQALRGGMPTAEAFERFGIL